MDGQQEGACVRWREVFQDQDSVHPPIRPKRRRERCGEEVNDASQRGEESESAAERRCQRHGGEMRDRKSVV